MAICKRIYVFAFAMQHGIGLLCNGKSHKIIIHKCMNESIYWGRNNNDKHTCMFPMRCSHAGTY